MLTATLAVAALAAGLAGAWSPCGLSIVETLAPRGGAAGRLASIAGSLAFTAGALAGGILTFGGLALAGAQVGAAPGVAAAVAGAALLMAAAGDGAGRRLVPQVRRQVPESWRRRLPLPLAALLYGVLLGLGFTTFVLSFATYGIAIACLALGEPALGAVVGAAFALGRALPVVVLAPIQDRDAGIAAAATMAERPIILRSLRKAAAVATAAAAGALALAGAPAHAARPLLFFDGGSDPSAAGPHVVWENAQGQGLLKRGGRDQLDLLPGSDPALGPDLVAWIEPGKIVVARMRTLLRLQEVPADAVTAVAVSTRFLAWRQTRPDGWSQLVTLDRKTPGAVPAVRLEAPPTDDLGAPAIFRHRLVFHLVQRSSSQIRQIDLASGRRRLLRRATDHLLLNPSIRRESIAYVRSTALNQQVVIGRISPGAQRRDRAVYTTMPTARRDLGVEPGRHEHQAGYRQRGGRPRLPRRPPPGLIRTLWTTALTDTHVYLTELRPRRDGGTRARIVTLEHDA